MPPCLTTLPCRPAMPKASLNACVRVHVLLAPCSEYLLNQKRRKEEYWLKKYGKVRAAHAALTRKPCLQPKEAGIERPPARAAAGSE